MTYETNPNRKIAAAVSFADLLSATALSGVSLTLSGVFADIVKIAALALFMGAVTVIGRYLTFNYVYIVDESEFAVYRKTNKGHIPLCRLYRYELTDILASREAKARLAGIRRYDYRMTLGTKEYYCLFFDTAEGEEVIFLECDKRFAEYLKKCIAPDLLAESVSDCLDNEF